MQAYIRYPDAAAGRVDCEAVGHEELPGAPACQHLACVLMQAQDGFSADEGLGVSNVVAAVARQEGLCIPHLCACKSVWRSRAVRHGHVFTQAYIDACTGLDQQPCDC